MFFYATGLTTGEDENKDVKIALSPVFVEVLSVVILHIVCTWSCVAGCALSYQLHAYFRMDTQEHMQGNVLKATTEMES